MVGVNLDLITTGLLLIVSILSASILVSCWITGGVPPLSSKVTEAADAIALLQQAGLHSRAIIYDLGCGWGSLVIALAHAFPLAQIRGIELSPLPYWVARFRTRNIRNVTLKRGDFQEFDLRDADGITCYLMIKPMIRLAALLDHMLKHGTPVVAITFWFRGRQVDAVRKGRGIRGDVALYFWPALNLENIEIKSTEYHA